jgi:hypothetical protein
MLDPLSGRAADDDVSDAGVWSDFEAYLIGGLREQWTPTSNVQRGDADVLAHSRLHLLTLTVDIAGRAHVCVTRRSGLVASEATLALRTLDATACPIFERLAKRWPLRVRTGPFASAPWRPDSDAVGAA